MYIVYLPEDYTAVAFLTPSVLSYDQEPLSGFYTEWKKQADEDSLWAAEQFIPHADVPDLPFQT